MKQLGLLLLVSFAVIAGAEPKPDLTHFYGTYRGTDSKGQELLVRVEKGSGFIGRDLFIARIYPDGSQIQAFLEFPEGIQRSDGRGGLLVDRPHLEGENRLVIDTYRRTWIFGRKFDRRRWSTVFELVRGEGETRMNISEAGVVPLIGKEVVYDSCVVALIATPKES